MDIFTFLFSKYILVELLGPGIDMCLLLQEMVELFSKVIVSFHILTTNGENFHCLHILTNSIISLYF